MTSHARRFASVPTRTASDTWRFVTDALASEAHRATFDATLNAAAVLIADEVTATTPITFTGVGPRVLIYTVHSEDAATGHNVNEAVVPNLVYSDDWVMYLPNHPTEPGLIDALIDSPHVVIGAPPAATQQTITSNVGSRIDGFDLAALESR